jgi:hypothetical protein
MMRDYFRRIRESIILDYHQEPLSVRVKRMVSGVLIGFFISLIYSLAATLVNPLTLPQLHLITNWQVFFETWLVMSLGFGLAGGIVGWFTENIGAIFGGGVIIAGLVVTIVIIAYLNVQNKIPFLFVYLVALLPILGASIVIAWGFRSGINHISRIRLEENRVRRKSLVWNFIIIVFLVGFIPGSFNRFDLTAIDTLTRMNNGLEQNDFGASSNFRFPEEFVPGLTQRSGMAYSLYSRPSRQSVGFIEVTIYYEDGYTLTCMVPAEIALYNYASPCNEGEKLIPIQPAQ